MLIVLEDSTSVHDSYGKRKRGGRGGFPPLIIYPDYLFSEKNM